MKLFKDLFSNFEDMTMSVTLISVNLIFNRIHIAPTK